MATAPSPNFPRPHFDLRPWALALVACILFSPAGPARAVTDAEGAPLVEVRSNDDAYMSYAKRRNTHGWQFGFGMENYKPKNLASSIDPALYPDYASMIGKDIPLYYLEFGYKYNMSVGSLSALFGYGQGKGENTPGGEPVSLQISRNSLKFMFIADNFMEEPYVAPYGAFTLWQMAFDEAIDGSDGISYEYSAKTQMGNSITFGALIQLNALEIDASRWAWLSTGLENTYLDLFVTQVGKSGGADDPDTTGDFNWGAGFRLEF